MNEVPGKALAGLRICIVYDCLYPLTVGGAEHWYRTLADALAGAGGSVTYLTRAQWDGTPPPVPGVAVVAVTGRHRLYRSDGTRRVYPPIAFGWGVFWWLVRHRGDFDAVHTANFPYFSLPAVRAALSRTTVPTFVDWFEIWPTAFWRNYAGAAVGSIGAVMQRLCVTLSANPLVFSEVNAGRLRRAGCQGTITVLAGLLPGTDHALPRATYDPSQPLVLFVGRHIEDKGVQLLPEVLQIARTEIPGLTMVMTGDGPLRSRVAADLGSRGLQEAATFAGQVAEDELAGLFSKASCLVVASTREGYGMAAVEATSFGTPIVVASNPENLAVGLVIEGVNGFVTDPTPAGLAQGVVSAVAAGQPLRHSTRAWYEEHAPRMSTAVSTSQVISLYAARCAVARQNRRGASQWPGPSPKDG